LTPSPEILVKLEGIRFAYPKGPEVLKGLSLRLDSDSRLGLVGSNGAGKTTLLSIIMGLIKPTAGSVEILGRRRVTEADFREARPKLGFVFQDASEQLFCPTVADDIAFGPLNLGSTSKEAREVGEEVLESLGLQGFGPRVTYNLSGGERRLVALATALALRPRLLILDEPTTFLDDSSVARLEGVLAKSPLPLLIVSHDRDFLDRVVERRLRLKDGLVVEG
jgi:cobalt/nickel transport system ATP-binding protein